MVGAKVGVCGVVAFSLTQKRRGAEIRRRVFLSLAAGAGAGRAQGAERYLLVEVAGARRVATRDADGAAAAPGSTVKPFALSALLKAGKLTEWEAFPCPGKLTIAGRQLNCSHPPLVEPVRVETAIAYSCNCFVARVAERFDAGELAATLERAGLRRGLRRLEGEGARLQALGETGVLATAAELAMAYRWLATNAPEPVQAGMEGAVMYGTAQLAGVPGAKVAGKTGTVFTPAGNRIAWFAGFAPSRGAKVALAVMMPGVSGGGDAAPVAGRILKEHEAAWR